MSVSPALHEPGRAQSSEGSLEEPELEDAKTRDTEIVTQVNNEGTEKYGSRNSGQEKENPKGGVQRERPYRWPVVPLDRFGNAFAVFLMAMATFLMLIAAKVQKSDVISQKSEKTPCDGTEKALKTGNPKRINAHRGKLESTIEDGGDRSDGSYSGETCLLSSPVLASPRVTWETSNRSANRRAHRKQLQAYPDALRIHDSRPKQTVRGLSTYLPGRYPGR